MNTDKWGHWRLVKSEPGPDLNIFATRYDTFIHPVTQNPLRATILETQPWVHVIARTSDGHIVMVRQFRFGARAVTLEVPAGIVNPMEEPGDAAARELLEETGFQSTQWRSLGSVDQNPASHTDSCYMWLAEQAEATGRTNPDEDEHIQVQLLTEEAIKSAVKDGLIRNPYTIVTLSRIMDLRTNL